jgi:uncharacterized membrane protein YphA (DoxX/SURF4 family)
VQVPVIFTLLLRLIPGYLFLQAGIAKIQHGWPSAGLRAAIEKWLASGGTYTWYEPFLTDVVLPNDRLFATLVLVGEIAVGSLLLIGFLVRPASLAGVFLVLNFLCAKGSSLVGLNVESLLLVILVTSMLVNPGRSLGVDGFLYERLRLPAWLI